MAAPCSKVGAALQSHVSDLYEDCYVHLRISNLIFLVLEVEAIETIVLMGLVWALGGTLERAGRITFDSHLRERLRKRGCARPFPNEATVFDYFFDWGIQVTQYLLQNSFTYVRYSDLEDVGNIT